MIRHASIKWTERLVQYALTRRHGTFYFRKYISVPNVSHGLLMAGEADLMSLGHNGFHEIEIKVSKSDIVADRKKCATRYHNDPLFMFSWFAVPLELVDYCRENIDKRFGIVAVMKLDANTDDADYLYRSRVVRRPKRNPLGVMPTDKTVADFMRLGVMRMWSERRFEMRDQ